MKINSILVLTGAATLALMVLMLADGANSQTTGLKVSPSAATTVHPSPSATAGLSESDAELRLDSVESELRELALDRVVRKPQKDVWDKLSSASTLVSGLIVALIGFYATDIYDKRQKEAEDRIKEQALTVSQIQTVEKFIPHLSSKDETVKSAALISIAALGNDELAVKLARAFRGSGSASALASIATTAAAPASAAASRALEDLLNFLKVRVVSIYDAEARRASGFVLSSGRIITTARAVHNIPDDHLRVMLPDGSTVTAERSSVGQSADLALLTIESPTAVPAMKISSLESWFSGAPVIGLFPGQNGQFKAQVGQISAFAMTIVISYSDGSKKTVNGRVEVEISSTIASGGAPVLDQQGSLIGIVEASTDLGYTYLIPASAILALVPNQQGQL
jgi:hypothetical protein